MGTETLPLGGLCYSLGVCSASDPFLSSVTFAAIALVRDPSQSRPRWNMELPQVMKLSRERRASSPDACPGQISWDYDRAELRAHRRRHDRRDSPRNHVTPGRADKISQPR
jgi:hypothetical protein